LLFIDKSIENSDNDDDNNVYLYKLQTRVLKNLHHMFPYRPARKAQVKKKTIIIRNKWPMNNNEAESKRIECTWGWRNEQFLEGIKYVL
jgi:hypothetical protein